MLGSLQVLEPMLAQVLQACTKRQVVCAEHARGFRKQHLAAVRGGRDTRGAVHVDSDVTRLPDRRLACVEPHSDAEGCTFWPCVSSQCSLALYRSGNGIARARKGEKKRITLRIDLA